VGVVERYLTAVAAADGAALGECITADLERVGPYGDVVTGREAYVAFISELIPRLKGYAMDVARVTYAGDLAFAEFSETVDGLVTPETIVFELRGEQIARLTIYIQQRP
jgi:ketosteroid isomerase-like protein